MAIYQKVVLISVLVMIGFLVVVESTTQATSPYTLEELQQYMRQYIQYYHMLQARDMLSDVDIDRLNAFIRLIQPYMSASSK